ncbi:MAG: hypothetical protein L0Z62_15935 [Gemmataceae bacterium]|nr:hypothetical protein [Gemmataceae bacterium]
MLERQALVLCPWVQGEGPPREFTRAILDGGSGEELGFVRRASSGPRWLRWLQPPVLEVYETEDASLLCTIHGRLWRRLWLVQDSEGRHVGVIDASVLLDVEGRRLGVRRAGTGGGSGNFVSPGGLELASFAPGERGLLVSFTAAVEGDPFARMILLAATLTQGG